MRRPRRKRINVRVGKVVGSNPATPTSFLGEIACFVAVSDVRTFVRHSMNSFFATPLGTETNYLLSCGADFYLLAARVQ